MSNGTWTFARKEKVSPQENSKEKISIDTTSLLIYINNWLFRKTGIRACFYSIALIFNRTC